MDKRSLFFILAVGASFFLVNFYFTQQNQERERIYQEHQEKKAERIRQERAKEIEKKTVKANQLPLVEIYGDNALSEFLSIGVVQNDALLTIGWNESIPDTVFVREYQSTDPLTPYHLNKPIIYNAELIYKGAPLVYSKTGKENLTMVDMPLFGKYDLQLVSLYPREPSHPLTLGLGEYTDGHFISLRMNLPQEIPQAIALYKTKEGYIPVGIVQGTQEQLVDLEEFDSIFDFLSKMQLHVPLKDDSGFNERFFVLENGYQQLVFSNKGGALVGINLPLKEQSDVSVVRPIEVDRDMLEVDPKNALFPGVSYFLPGVKPQGPFEENKSSQEGGYYPLIRRNFIEPITQKVTQIDPQFYAFNLVGDYPEISSALYQVTKFDKEHIVFENEQPHRKIRKIFHLLPTEEAAPYVFSVSVEIEGDARGLWLSSGVPEAEWIAGSYAPALKTRIKKGKDKQVDSIDLPKDAITVTSLNPDWICNSNGFFGVIMDPLTQVGAGWRAVKVPGGTTPSRLMALEKDHPEWNAQDLPGYMMMLPLPTSSETSEFRVFAGPFSTTILNEVDAIFTSPETGLGPDYIASQSFHGWFTFISEPFAKFLFWIMDFFHSLFGSWALSIVLVTIVLRILLYPLTAWSTRSMLAMKRIQPKVQKLQEKYKNDNQKMQTEIFELYRQEKVNPMSGCLPLLIQMPFLIGMFDLLKSTFALRGASFIPGWIDNLAAPDVLFTWGTHIPFIGTEFHLLPILLGIVMFFQAKMGMQKKESSQMTEQERQQQATGTIMAIFFTVLFYRFPSGLNIYWLSSMLLGILQQWWTGKYMASKEVQVKS